MQSRKNIKSYSGRYLQKRLEEDLLSSRYHMRKEKIIQQQIEREISNSNILTCQKIEEDLNQFFHKRKNEDQDLNSRGLKYISSSIAIQTMDADSYIESNIENDENTLLKNYFEDETLNYWQDLSKCRKSRPQTPHKQILSYKSRRTKTLDIEKLLEGIPVAKKIQKYSIRALKSCKYSKDAKSIDLDSRSKTKTTKKKYFSKLLSKANLFEKSTLYMNKKKTGIESPSKNYIDFRGISKPRSVSFIKERPASNLHSYRDEDGIKLRDLRKHKLLENIKFKQ